MFSQNFAMMPGLARGIGDAAQSASTVGVASDPTDGYTISRQWKSSLGLNSKCKSARCP